MDISREMTEVIKVWLAGGALILVAAWPRLPVRWAHRALTGLILFAALNYARFGTQALTTRVDVYDLLHYYVNAKYFDELGYYDLYPAMLYVDREHGGPFFNERPDQKFMAQDDEGHHFAPVAEGVARGAEVRTRFAPARWAAFEHDILYLQRTLGCSERSKAGKCSRELSDGTWNELINDHGFNGTLAWVWLAKPFTAMPIEAVKILGYLDVLLLGGALLLVRRAYGGVAAGFTLLFLLVTYSTRWPYLSWVLLRYDWVALLLAAAALLREGRPFLGGLAAGTSAVLRLFPALWMWGPFAQGVAELVRGRLHRPALALAAGFLLAAATVQGAAVARFGVDQAVVHVENMLDHNSAEQLSSRRIGLALTLATEPWRGTAQDKLISKARRQRIGEQEPIRYGLAAVGMFVLGIAVARRRQDEAFAYGFIPFFLITTASYYYYVARATLVVLHASEMTSLRQRVCLGMLFGLELFSNFAEAWYRGHRMFLIGTLAWGLTAYVVVAIGWLLYEQRAALFPESPRPDPTPAGG